MAQMNQESLSYRDDLRVQSLLIHERLENRFQLLATRVAERRNVHNALQLALTLAALAEPPKPPKFSAANLPRCKPPKIGVDERCAVCLADYESDDVCIQLPCKHVLHEACAIQLIEQYAKTSCTECRQAIFSCTS